MVERKELRIWIIFGAAFLCVLYFTFHKTSAPGGSKEKSVEGRIAPAPLPAPTTDQNVYHARRAHAFEAHHDYEKAAKEYEALLKLNPGDRLVHDNLVTIYYKMGRKDAAIAEIREVLKIDPANRRRWETLGDLYVEQGDPDNAIWAYEESLRIEPDNALCNDKLGKLYYSRKKYESALRAFKKVAELNLKRAEAQLGIGLCYRALGRNDEALKQREILLQLKRDDLAKQLP